MYFERKAHTREVNGKTIPVRESKILKNSLLTVGTLGALAGIYGGYKGIKKIKSIVNEADYVVKTAKQKVDSIDVEQVNETIQNIKNISKNIDEGSTKVNNTLNKIPFIKKPKRDNQPKKSLGRKVKELMWRNMGKSEEWISQNKNCTILSEFNEKLELIRKINEETHNYEKNRPKYMITGGLLGAGLGVALTPIIARKLSGKLSPKEISKLKTLRNSLHPDKPLKFLPPPKGTEKEALENAKNILKQRNEQFINIQNKIDNNDNISYANKKDLLETLGYLGAGVGMGTGSIAYDVVNRKKRRDYEKKTKEYWENLKNYR